MREGLERKISVPKELENSFEIKHEENKKIAYVGRIYNINFHEGNVYGNASLRRIEISLVESGKRISWFPPKKVTTLKPIENEEWTIYADNDRYVTGNRVPIILDGEPCKKRSGGGYRARLLDNTVNFKRISFSDELLDSIFSGMEKELVKIYKEMHFKEDK